MGEWPGAGTNGPGTQTAVDLIAGDQGSVRDDVRVIEVVLRLGLHPLVELGRRDAFAPSEPAPVVEWHPRIPQAVIGRRRARAARELTSGSSDDLGGQAGMVGVKVRAHEQR